MIVNASAFRFSGMCANGVNGPIDAPDDSQREVLPSLWVIWVNQARRQEQKRSIFTKIVRIEAGHFYPKLAKVGNAILNPSK